MTNRSGYSRYTTARKAGTAILNKNLLSKAYNAIAIEMEMKA